MLIKSRPFNIVYVAVASMFLMQTINTANAHSSSLNKIALEVCKQKERSQACQYNGGHNDLYIGTCQYISEHDLTCVRNQPIQKVESDKHSHNIEANQKKQDSQKDNKANKSK
ncbi:hypothetical protein [uncultured Psychrosphaera sp.]|uniref:hypothetical protein n=1 Tax=uncultured Psychrosphaera sp. TaxID=1403522 RepID=UPI0026087E4F|nr:hypothetical protein [uncultured Psychrosphaera sp.]